jgi:hypothetical protein
MNLKRMLIYVACTGLVSILSFFGTQPGIAGADSEPPSTPVLEGGVWSTGTVVAICVLAVVVVALGVFFIRRARAKRRASEPGAGS